MAGEELGRGVIHQIRAVLEWTHQIRRCERRIDEQGQPVFVGELRHSRDIEYLEAGVAQRFAEQQARGRADRRTPAIDAARVNERGLDTDCLLYTSDAADE